MCTAQETSEDVSKINPFFFSLIRRLGIKEHLSTETRSPREQAQWSEMPLSTSRRPSRAAPRLSTLVTIPPDHRYLCLVSLSGSLVHVKLSGDTVPYIPFPTLPCVREEHGFLWFSSCENVVKVFVASLCSKGGFWSRTSLTERILLVLVAVLLSLIVLLLWIGTFRPYGDASTSSRGLPEVCLTPECVKVASSIMSAMDSEVSLIRFAQ